MAYGLASKTPDFNAQVNQLVQMAIQSGNPQFLREYSKSPTANRLVVELAQGVVDQQMNGVENMKRLSQPSNVPTVLDQRQMGGLPGMPTYNMFNPSAYEQGGIGAGVVEPDSEPEQMAGGGVVAFQEGGNTSTPENPVAQIIMALDSQIEAAVREGQDPSELVRQRDMVIKTASAEALATAPAFDASGIPIPETVAATALAGTLARPPAAAGLPAALPAAPTTAAPTTAAPTTAAPTTAAPTTAAPTTSPPKPGMLRQGVDAAKKFTGIGTPSGQTGTLRKGLNKAGLPGLLATGAAYVGDALKETTGAQWLQSLITPVSPEEHDANLANNQVTSPETAKIVYAAAVQRESNGMQLYPKGHPKAGQPVTSPKGAIGVGQVMPDTAKEAAQLAGLPWDEARYKNDKDYNYAIGQAYFYKQLDTFKGSVPSALAAYNAGPAVVQSYLTGEPVRLKDGRIINPTGIKTPNGIPPYGETEKYVANIQGRISTYLTDKAQYAPEKPGVVRAVEMVQKNLPEFMGGTGGPGGVAVQNLKEGLGDDPYRGLSLEGFKNVITAVPKVASGIRNAIMGPPDPKLAGTAVQPVLPGQPGMTAAQFAAEDTQRQQAAQTALDREDRRRIAMALMMSGAKGLQGTSPYALQNLGAGFEEGLKGYAGMREADAKRAATASEKEQDRAMKAYQENVKMAIAVRKQALPLEFDKSPELQTAIATLGFINTMSPRMRAAAGIDNEEIARLQQYTKVLGGGLPKGVKVTKE